MTTPQSITISTDHTDFDVGSKKMLSEFLEVKKMLNALLKMQAGLKLNVEKLLQYNPATQGSFDCVELETSMPISKISQLDYLEKELEDEKKFSSFTRKVMLFGGSDEDNFLHNIAKFMFKDKLLVRFSLCGKKGKFPFNVYKNILEAQLKGINLNEKFAVTRKQVHDFYGRYLRNAPGRIKSEFFF